MNDLLVLIALAVAPCILIGLFILWRDRMEQEPLNLVVWAFLGGIAAVVPPYFLTTSLQDIMLGGEAINSFERIIEAFICIALVEEGSKYFFFRLIVYPNKQFEKATDGIIYSVMIAMGFAMVENMLYVLSDSANGISIAMQRMYTVVPAHGMFAISMGYYAAHAKTSNYKRSYLLLAIVCATLLHGFYDYFILSNNITWVYIGAAVSVVFSGYLVYKAIQEDKKSPSPARGVTGDEAEI